LELPFPEKFGREFHFLQHLYKSGKNFKLEHDYLYWEFHEKGGRQALRKGDWEAFKLRRFKKSLMPDGNFIICREDYWGKNNCGRIPPERW